VASGRARAPRRPPRRRGRRSSMRATRAPPTTTAWVTPSGRTASSGRCCRATCSACAAARTSWWSTLRADPGHVASHAPDDGILLTGDLPQDGDVAWVLLDGPEDLEPIRTLIRVVERLAALEPRLVLPGHGAPVVRDVPRVVDATLARYAGWLEDPLRAMRHAGKRAAAFWLMTQPPPLAEAAARMAPSPGSRRSRRARRRPAGRGARAPGRAGPHRRAGAPRAGRLTTSLPHCRPARWKPVRATRPLAARRGCETQPQAGENPRRHAGPTAPATPSPKECHAPGRRRRPAVRVPRGPRRGAGAPERSVTPGWTTGAS
jgi:hypothetical protein